MSVNELAKRWLGGLSFSEAWASGDPHMEAYGTCAEDVTEVARTAWHPSSEPPTEADSNDSKHVMCVMADGSVQSINYALVCEYGVAIGPWARIRDVVLMPPQGGE